MERERERERERRNRRVTTNCLQSQRAVAPVAYKWVSIQVRGVMS